jgi:hypothetical protein
MGFKNILGWILKVPLILLVLSTIGIGFYAAAGQVPGFVISYGAPIFLLALVGLYYLGEWLCLRERRGSGIKKSNYLDPTNSNYDEETRIAIEQYEQN